ncbi:MAG: hypothetical protein NTV11_14395 [Rhodocyclales bacterium]|nr:hypothetical protein [Rhodocyclales bacterium]
MWRHAWQHRLRLKMVSNRGHTGRISACVTPSPTGEALIFSENIFSELTRRCDTEFVVALEEGFGNREWLWFPATSQEELEAWWSALENVETFWHLEARKSWPGEFFRMDQSIELSGLWESVWNRGRLRARVDMNEQSDLAAPDTYLQRADGKKLLHKGAYELAAR